MGYDGSTVAEPKGSYFLNVKLPYNHLTDFGIFVWEIWVWVSPSGKAGNGLSASRIIAAARVIAEREGWDAVTIRRLADEIEYSQPVLYSHFENRDAIVASSCS